MRKYAYRLSAALPLALRTGPVSGYNRPYSVLEGNTVRIKPYGASFQIPEAWLTPVTVPDPAQNLYYRAVGEKSVVFVFLHAGGFQPTIDGILSSFESGPSLHDAEEFHVQ